MNSYETVVLMELCTLLEVTTLLQFKIVSFNTENLVTVNGGALISTSLNIGNFTIRGSEFYRNSAPQCGAVDLKSG